MDLSSSFLDPSWLWFKTFGQRSLFKIQICHDRSRLYPCTLTSLDRNKTRVIFMSVWSVQPIDSMGISIDWFPLIVPAVAKIAKLVYSSNNYGLWVHDNPITSNYYSIWRAICCFLFFSRQVFDFLGGFLVLCFPVSLLFCFSALCFSASLLSLLLCFSCFSAFPASLAYSDFLLFPFPASVPFCFSVFPASLRFYFFALLLLLSTFSFLRSCVFAALLPAPLLLCFLSFCLFVFHFLLLYSVLFVS